MTRRPSVFNPAPDKMPVSPEMTLEAAREVFASRLQHTMLKKGWTQSDLSREASKHMPNKKFGRDLISNYIRARMLPDARHAQALSKALGTSVEDLIPARGPRDSVAPRMSTRDAGDGNAWLQINQAVPWAVALKVMQILQQGES
jgi:transcriptional regulator with XRE-family HTH domain